MTHLFCRTVSTETVLAPTRGALYLAVQVKTLIQRLARAAADHAAAIEFWLAVPPENAAEYGQAFAAAQAAGVHVDDLEAEVDRLIAAGCTPALAEFC